MKATEKSEGIDRLLGEIFGIDRKEAISNSLCSMCKKHVIGFRDARSMKEYTISGLCQECQDRIFGIQSFGGGKDD